MSGLAGAEERFVKAAIRHSEARGAASVNRAFDELIEAYHQLRARDDGGRPVFVGLLWHKEPGVVLWAASFALWEDEAAARAVLLRLDDGDAAPEVKMSAYQTLKEWDAGRLKRPEDW